MNSVLQTDLYELTMAAAYFENGLNRPATFEIFVRSLPDHLGYLIATGLEQALDYLEDLRFNSEQIEFLKRQPIFGHVSGEFFDYLAQLRFTGEVWAMEEVRQYFRRNPCCVSPRRLSKDSLSKLMCSRRSPFAAYIGGCAGSSNVEASHRFGIPIFGTLAHSFISAYQSEQQSFTDFARVFPDDLVILLDTYDTLLAIDKLVAAHLRPSGIRFDSGDLLSLSKQVRAKLDRNGLEQTKIVASSDLDEHVIASLLAQGAPIDIFGVGAALATSKDAPALGGVYKLVEFDGQPRAKLSQTEEKASYPGRKQVVRFSESGSYLSDVVGLESERYDADSPFEDGYTRRAACRTTSGFG